MDNSNNKDFKSAIIVAVPEELNTQIQDLRKLYDKAFVRWMPHINLIFPFVKIEDFDNKFTELQKVIGTFKPFKLVYRDFGYFQHGKSCVVWLRPETPEDPTILTRIQSALEGALPGFNELSTKSEAGFQPHLTVGQFGGLKQTTDKIESFKKTFKAIEFTVSEIYMIHRDGDVPFTIRHCLKLNGN
ncbi:hypothetical protein DLAC_00607 [Tieghemostelium lacteum]|uniref:Uncharacterized protein n=1 Tax=Tieghemostelium lacteum TaxID=361077 RepID=A0A152AA62_TIELA|nr:hypothetical protein DLAC_00607 [Tieghemostelium lacteum]|eukprot:KYR03112.1 hypothetical protein DLAC_00607 [Tieghemostelium lacteum]